MVVVVGRVELSHVCVEACAELARSWCLLCTLLNCAAYNEHDSPFKPLCCHATSSFFSHVAISHSCVQGTRVCVSGNSVLACPRSPQAGALDGRSQSGWRPWRRLQSHRKCGAQTHCAQSGQRAGPTPVHNTSMKGCGVSGGAYSHASLACVPLPYLHSVVPATRDEDVGIIRVKLEREHAVGVASCRLEDTVCKNKGQQCK